jgi:hypothetical protein
MLLKCHEMIPLPLIEDVIDEGTKACPKLGVKAGFDFQIAIYARTVSCKQPPF